MRGPCSYAEWRTGKAPESMAWKRAELSPRSQQENPPVQQLLGLLPAQGGSWGAEEGAQMGPRWQIAAQPGQDSDLDGAQGQFSKSLAAQ